MNEFSMNEFEWSFSKTKLAGKFYLPEKQYGHHKCLQILYVFQKHIVRLPDWLVSAHFYEAIWKKTSGLGPIKYLLVFNEQSWQNKRGLTSCQKYVFLGPYLCT